MDWTTDPPPIGVALELLTAAGDTLTGEVSFIAAHGVGEGRNVRQYMLRDGSRRIFDVVRWRVGDEVSFARRKTSRLVPCSFAFADATSC